MRLSKLLLTICTGVLLSPSLVLAQGNPNTLVPHPTPGQSGQANASDQPHATPNPAQFCANVTGVKSQITSGIAGSYGALTSNLSVRSGSVRNGMQGVSQKLMSARSEADTKRQAQFAALLAKATTADQKAAILTFETSVTEAVTVNRTAVNQADQTFEQGLLASINDRQSTLQPAALAFKTATANALAQAAASCTSGMSPQTVRATLQSALQSARTALNASVQNANKIGPNISALESARQTAVQAASTALKASILQAITALKAALGTTSSPSPSPTSSSSPSPTP